MKEVRSTDGYGMHVYPWTMPDPLLEADWRILRRDHNEEGEHIWYMIDGDGIEFRWLELEHGPEWSYRKAQLSRATKPSATQLVKIGVE